MSAKNRKKRSDPAGAYYTPSELARQMVEQVLPQVGFAKNAPRTILEPAVGQGVFLRPLRDSYPLAKITGIDLRAVAIRQAAVLDIEISEKTDFLDHRYLDAFDLIIGNPPYEQALEFCRKSLVLAPVVVFLLRLGFLASVKRHMFWVSNPPSRVFVCSKRPSFTGDRKTDQTDYCVVCWQRGVARTTLDWLPVPGRV